MDNSWALILLLLIPLTGAIVGAFIAPGIARLWALLVSLATFIVSLVVASAVFDGHPPVFHPASDPAHLPAIGASFALGVNSISVWLILLTTFLQPLAILSSFESIKLRQREYYAWMNALLVVMLGVFMARDLLLFYVFFELTLVPMFFIIGIWGGPDRQFAAAKFFLFTFTGGVLTLAATIYLGMSAHTFALDDAINAAGAVSHVSVVHFAQSLPEAARFWVLLGLMAGFAVKTPLFPVHTWLPLAHTEAPTAGSVILAGVLLKLGTYGLLVLAVPIGLVGATSPIFQTVIHVVAGICVIGIIYGALCAWVQPDIKKLVAFSSVSHLGFCVLGLIAMNDIGMQGSVLYMINHGLSTGAMFLVIGMIYDRYHTRDINQLSGLAKVMPLLSFFFVFFMLSSIGLPGLNGFWSEFLTMLGAFTAPRLMWYGTVAAIGVILGAVYMLHMTARVIMGPLKVPAGDHGHGDAPADHGHDSHAPAKNDIGFRETLILVPLAIAVVVLGVQPNLIMNSIRTPIEQLRQTSAAPQAPAKSTAVAQADAR